MTPYWLNSLPIALDQDLEVARFWKLSQVPRSVSA